MRLRRNVGDITPSSQPMAVRDDLDACFRYGLAPGLRGTWHGRRRCAESGICKVEKRVSEIATVLGVSRITVYQALDAN